jgi:hypothetical protein
MSGTISYLAVDTGDHQIIVDAFLRKVGRKPGSEQKREPVQAAIKPHVPKLKKAYTDKEKTSS